MQCPVQSPRAPSPKHLLAENSTGVTLQQQGGGALTWAFPAHLGSFGLSWPPKHQRNQQMQEGTSSGLKLQTAVLPRECPADPNLFLVRSAGFKEKTQPAAVLRESRVSRQDGECRLSSVGQRSTLCSWLSSAPISLWNRASSSSDPCWGKLLLLLSLGTTVFLGGGEWTTRPRMLRAALEDLLSAHPCSSIAKTHPITAG